MRGVLSALQRTILLIVREPRTKVGAEMLTSGERDELLQRVRVMRKVLTTATKRLSAVSSELVAEPDEPDEPQPPTDRGVR